jgi:hypothetical protein
MRRCKGDVHTHRHQPRHRQYESHENTFEGAAAVGNLVVFAPRNADHVGLLGLFDVTTRTVTLVDISGYSSRTLALAPLCADTIGAWHMRGMHAVWMRLWTRASRAIHLWVPKWCLWLCAISK